MKEKPSSTSYKITLSVFVVLAGFQWFLLNDARATWSGVPPAPQQSMMTFQGLGDAQMSYRMSSLMVQNFGDTGGRAVALAEYDYERLGVWLERLYALDKRSDFVPMLAAYYFGAVMDLDRVVYMVNFLEKAGQDPVGEKWRWLVQAIVLTRFKIGDLDRALEMSYKLADLGETNKNMPTWTRQMPAFVLAAKGEKEAAKEIMRVIMGSTKTLHPNELNYMKAYIEDDL